MPKDEKRSRDSLVEAFLKMILPAQDDQFPDKPKRSNTEKQQTTNKKQARFIVTKKPGKFKLNGMGSIPYNSDELIQTRKEQQQKRKFEQGKGKPNNSRQMDI